MTSKPTTSSAKNRSASKPYPLVANSVYGGAYQGAINFIKKTGSGIGSAFTNPFKGTAAAFAGIGLSGNVRSQVVLAKTVQNLEVKKVKPTGNGNGNGDGGGSGVKPKIETPVQVPIQAYPDSTYSWNLPPHAWSLPVEPDSMTNFVNKSAVDHSKRRGVIFVARKYSGPTVTVDSKTGKKTTNASNFTRNYGFQFLWNPETFNQSTSVNWGITPNQNDPTSLLTGLTTANSTLSLSIRIDRTNDFASSRAAFVNKKPTNREENDRALLYVSGLSDFYKKGQAPGSSLDFQNNMEEKIRDLLTRGTEADLEFLYRTINGDGYKSSWGTTTSNISFLMPTIVRIDLGPQKFVGMVQSINVNHLAFTRDMVPIRTDVTLSIDLRTAAGLTTSNFNTTSDQQASVFNK